MLILLIVVLILLFASRSTGAWRSTAAADGDSPPACGVCLTVHTAVAWSLNQETPPTDSTSSLPTRPRECPAINRRRGGVFPHGLRSRADLIGAWHQPGGQMWYIAHSDRCPRDTLTSFVLS
jgi:hypothetical protein